jgi:hypothetical protein
LALGIKHALHRLTIEHGVAIIGVKGFAVMTHWHIVHPAKKQLAPIAQAFKAHLLSHVVAS